jgi:lipopolysaccharide transport system permease protein
MNAPGSLKTSSSLKNPFAWLGPLRKHRRLIIQMTQREIISKYKGSIFGALWILITPLLMLSIYTFVFSVVFNARWGTASVNRLDFALFVFSGLIFFNFFAESLARSPSLILENISFVKKVVFPTEILPIIVILGSLFGAMVNFIILLLIYLFVNGLPPATVIFFPLLFVPIVLFTLGVCWLLSSLGVFVRDLKPAIGILITMIMFLCPIFYPISAVPAEFQKVMLINPLAIPLEESKKILFFGELPDLYWLMISTSVSVVCCWLGYAWFMLTKKGFADVV